VQKQNFKLKYTVVLVLILLSACNSRPETLTEEEMVATIVAETLAKEEMIATIVAETIEKESSPPPVSFSVIKKEAGSSTDCLLYIRLKNRTNEGEVISLSEYLKKREGKDCFPLYLYFYLEDEVPGTDIPWANSKYDPKLEVTINGLDLQTEATLEAKPLKSAGNLIGVWIDTEIFPHKIEIRKINSEYEMTTTYSDGSGEIKTLYIEIMDGEERLYENPGNYFGDYMVIRSNKNLAFYDNEGLIYELHPE
jgi:hypothetical protein